MTTPSALNRSLSGAPEKPQEHPLRDPNGSAGRFDEMSPGKAGQVLKALEEAYANLAAN